MLYELHYPKNLPTQLLIDNTAAIAVANTNAYNKRSKYIEIRYHHVQDSTRQKKVKVVH